jgi:heme exporter protein CcmD
MEKIILQFHTLEEALLMGDHGIYVWSTYIITGLVFLIFSITFSWKLRNLKEDE